MADDSTPIERGYCQCGCGERTTIAKYTQRARGIRKGEPNRYLVGHQTRKNATLENYVVAGDGCWEWRGRRNRDGYGMICRLGRQDLVHRVFYRERVGSIPEGLYVCHRCDNPPCVNPEHLFLGTHRDNMNDMEAKGRRSRGERHWRSEVTEGDVRDIRRAYADGGHTTRSLAARYGVASPTIHSIVTRKTWRHVA
jgi:hypothetical protein